MVHRLGAMENAPRVTGGTQTDLGEVQVGGVGDSFGAAAAYVPRLGREDP